jgi:hypothetical protein
MRKLEWRTRRWLPQLADGLFRWLRLDRGQVLRFIERHTLHPGEHLHSPRADLPGGVPRFAPCVGL